MLFKLSVNNIRRSMKDYAVYFFTLIIGVSIFYVLNSISTQAAFMVISNDTHKMLDVLRQTISGVSGFVAIVLGLLIVYAGRFLMKRRNREFALYLMMGMSKVRISFILFVETVIIGIGSLAVGMILGTGLSQLMAALVADLFDADMSAYKFTVSGEAVKKTVMYFTVMYIVVMLLNTFIIGKCRLIDLISSGKRSEQMKQKNLWVCAAVFIISVSVLAFSYYKVGWDIGSLSRERFLAIIAAGSVCTLLIFWSVSGFILRLVMSAKNVYFRSLNSFTFRQISSRINTAVVSMTVICLMLFLTICMLASAFSIRNSLNSNLEKYCPADVEIIYKQQEGDNVSDTADVSEVYTSCGYDITDGMKKYVNISIYNDPELTIKDALGDSYEELKEQISFLDLSTCMDIIRLSDYNELMDLFGSEKLGMGNDEYILICNTESMTEVWDGVIGKGSEISVFGRELSSHCDNSVDGIVDLSSMRLNFGTLIVPDDAVNESAAMADKFFGIYDFHDKAGRNAAEMDVQSRFSRVRDEVELRSEKTGVNSSVYLTTRREIEDDSVGIGAVVTFICLYIGFIFLISCAAVLALKQLSESADSIERYEMLRKIGADEDEISKSLFIQTGVFFLLPLILAAVHSVFGMKFGIAVLFSFGMEGVGKSVFMTSLIILLIYGGYFLITYYCSRYIIKNKKSG